jgi:hypothetical protein
MDKDTRKALLANYLEAETTWEEELTLRDWFAAHPADEDEREVAMLIEMTVPGAAESADSDAAVAAFDRMMAEAEASGRTEGTERPRRRKVLRWAAGLAAAAVLAGLVLLFRPRPETAPVLTPVQIAECIQQMMLLEMGDIESIVATPSGDRAFLTVYLRDGSTCAYILSYNGEDGTASLLACSTDDPS